LITLTFNTKYAALSGIVLELYGLGLELRLIETGDSAPPFKRPGKLLSRLGSVGRGMIGNDDWNWFNYEAGVDCTKE
jgi:hypothetical protein